MNAYKLETILDKDGSLTLEGLPFRSGVSVEVIVLEKSSPLEQRQLSIDAVAPAIVADIDYLSAVSATMTEWASEADEQAYHDL